MNPILCLDTETSGFDPRTCGIVEIGAVLVEDGRIADASYASLCWPGYQHVCQESHWKALQFNRIDPASLLKAPPVSEVLEEFARWLSPFAYQPGQAQGRVPVTSFNAPFDRGFLEAAAGWPRESLAWRECLMRRCQRHLWLPKAPSLAAACEAFGIARDGEHRALADARSAGLLYVALEGGR